MPSGQTRAYQWILFSLSFSETWTSELGMLSCEIVDPVPGTLYGAMPSRARQLMGNNWLPGLPQGKSSIPWMTARRMFSSSRPRKSKEGDRRHNQMGARLTHVSETGSAHMVSISEKSSTSRIATAACTVRFANEVALTLIKDNQMKKGDVLGVARVAGIMAAKRTPDLIPLCHPIAVSHVTVDLEPGKEGNTIEIRATVSCDGKTGVEMEALTAASTAALTVYDMCKAVDKGMIIEGLRVILKDGGKSGRWEMP